MCYIVDLNAKCIKKNDGATVANFDFAYLGSAEYKPIAVLDANGCFRKVSSKGKGYGTIKYVNRTAKAYSHNVWEGGIGGDFAIDEIQCLMNLGDKEKFEELYKANIATVQFTFDKPFTWVNCATADGEMVSRTSIKLRTILPDGEEPTIISVDVCMNVLQRYLDEKIIMF